jgi:CubicO group peptidase (beta-lactamase class C family)
MNGHGTARSVARMYAGLSGLLSSELLAEAVSTQSAGPDEVLKAVTHFGLGFMLYHDETPIGVRPNTFGHAGAGGSMAFHDPETGVSFCFAMNQMELGVITGGRSARTIADTVYSCL